MSRKHRFDDIGLLPALCATAQHAGGIIMGIYNEAAASDHILNTESKADNSPVTVADKISSAYISKTLRALTPHIPVVCEENDTAPGEDGTYWAVDPLDGTKEFIGRTGGFAVKIALLRRHVPVLAAVCAPAQGTLYYTATGLPSFKQRAEGIAILHTGRAPKRGTLTTLFNLTHADPAIYAQQRPGLEARGLRVATQPDAVPNLPRSLRVAEGLADIVVVTGKDTTLKGSGGYVWDNATDWLLVKNAGGIMIRLTDGKPMRFDTGRERMPAYVTVGDRKRARAAFPELN